MYTLYIHTYHILTLLSPLSFCCCLQYRVYGDDVTHSFVAVPFPPTDVRLSLKFVNGDVNITATWTVSSSV